MLDDDEVQWIKTTINELNNQLQIISESGQVLERISNESADTDKYFRMLESGVQRATELVQAMAIRVGGNQVATQPATSAQSELAQPSKASVLDESMIYNPKGALELVMVVDDEDYVRVLAQRVLAEAGYRVISARDGMEAIERYRHFLNDIKLVILDFTMPILDGADVYEELRLINPKVPVVLSSGFAEQERLRGMLAKGLRGFIPKPYSQDKLLAQVRTTLDTLRAEAQL
jgi:CheY-like chemotaxis protein